MTPRQGRQTNSWKRRLDKGRLYIPAEISPLFRQKVVLIKDPEGIRIGIRRKVPADIPKDRVFVEPVQKNLRGEKRILIPLALRDAFLLGSHGEIELIREDDKKFLITKNPL